MGKKSGSSKRGRDARTGEFITVDKARKNPNTTTVERVPHRGKDKDKK